MKKVFFISLCIAAHSYSFGQTWVSQEPAIQTQVFSKYHWVDLDGDGDTDIFEFGGYNGVIVHTRNGSSFTATQSGLPDNFFSVESNFRLNDYDYDGDLDIVFSRFNDVAIGVNSGNNSFTATDTNIAFNDNEYGDIYWQDVDGDLDLDVIRNKSIYLNNNGVYTRSSNVLDATIRRMIWRDINNDGLIDILCTIGYDPYSGNPLQVFVNKGGGKFQSAGIESEIRVPDNAALLLFDANNDGNLDIVAMDQIWGRCFVLRNTIANGQIQFAAPYSLGIGNSGIVATAGDLNADGMADLVIAGYSNSADAYQVMVFKNATSGNNLSFSKTNSFQSAVYVNTLQLTDYDADNDLDIHMKVYDQNVSLETNAILINTGTVAGLAPAAPQNLTASVGSIVNLAWTGQSQLAYNIEFKRNGQVIRVNPTNATGKLLMPDNSALISSQSFAVYNAQAGNYEWRVQSVDKSKRTSAFSAIGTFQIGAAPTGLTLQVLAMTSIKLCWNSVVNANSYVIYRRANNNATEEIATVPAATLCYTDATLEKNREYEYFDKAVSAGAHSAPSGLVTYNSSPFVPVSFGTLEPNIVSASCHPADYDLDGDFDLEFMGRILSNYGSDLNYRNDGTGNFPQKTSILPTLDNEYDFNKAVAARDMDNDGDTDFCVILGSDYGRQKLAVLLNDNGALTFGFQTDPYLAMYQASVADFNNDGRPDILYRHAVGNGAGNPHVYELLLQAQNGNFTASKFRFTEGDYGELGQFLIADLNNDGFQDICFTGTEYESLQFFINEDGMTFTRHSPSIAGVPLAFLDIDGDGITDFVNGDYYWYKGSANFQYTKQKLLHTSFSSNSPNISLADYNLDGLPDFIISDGYRSSVATNKGNAVFESGTMLLDEHWGSSVALTDLENDGDLDIVKLGNDSYHQGYNYLYRNQAEKFGSTNARPSVPTSLAATHSYGKLNMSWLSSTDDKTPQNFISYNLWVKDSGGKTWLHGETNTTGLFRRRLTSGNAGYRSAYTLRDLPAGTYGIRVQAIDAAFASTAWSPEVFVTIAPGPTNVQVERILLDKVKLTWSGSAFAEQKIIVERKSVESEYEVIAELAAGATSYIDDKLDYNNHYYYRITEASNTTTTAGSNVAEWSTLMWIVKETTIPNIYGSLDIADYTADGKTDILINGGRIYNSQTAEIVRAAFENTAAGWERHDITPSALSTTASLRFFDVDDDHKLDFYQQGYVWAEGYKTEIFQNTGNSTFSQVSNMFTQNAYEIQARYDIDMDNDMDLSVVDRANGDIRRLLSNNGGGDYAVSTMTDCGVGCYGIVASADFDGDGDEDFIRSEGGYFVLYVYGPDGLKNSGVTFSAYENSIAALDYNGDGLPDIALLTSSYYTEGKLYENRGLKDGTVKFELVRSDLPSGDNSINIADFDHDGLQDFMLLTPNGRMYRNTGQGSFEEYQIPYHTFGLSHSGVIDFDNDGDLDVYVTGYVGYQYNSQDEPFSRVLVNQIIDGGKGSANAAPPAPANLSAVQDAAGIHLTWLDGSDDHTTSAALTHDIVLYRDGKAILKAAIDPVTGQRQRIEPGRFRSEAIINNLTAGPYTWKVQAVDQAYKGSELSVAGSFIAKPVPPVAKDTTIYRCGRIVTLTAVGTDIHWYSDQALTKLIAAGEFHPDKSQVVYATQKVNGYESFPRQVSITIIDTTPQPIATSFSYCENYQGNVYMYAGGDEVKWYADINKSQLLSTNQNLTVPATERTYYATQTRTGCESAPLAVSVTKTVINTEMYRTSDKLEVMEKNGNFYIWYKNGLYIPTSNTAYIPYSGETGAYSVTVSKLGCMENSRVYNMPNDLPILAVEEAIESVWSVYPNPAKGYFTIDVKLSVQGVVKIYDATGRIVYTMSLNTTMGTETEPIRLPAGVYQVTLGDGTKVSSKRVVVY